MIDRNMTQFENTTFAIWYARIMTSVSLNILLWPISKAWASVESGVQRSFASYCMLRFQRTSRTRYFDRSCVSSICHESSFVSRNRVWMLLWSVWFGFAVGLLRGGRAHSGMKTIKQIIHGKLQAWHQIHVLFIFKYTSVILRQGSHTQSTQL